MQEAEFKKLREEMVRDHIMARGIADERIIEAFREVCRHHFVPLNNRPFSYQDSPLPIGESQTISQPYIVALMTQSLEIKKGHKVLEIGTGSGYQAAILAHLGAEVFTVERIPSLAKQAEETLDFLGYKVNVKVGDGTLGWPEHAPYDRIIVTAASPSVSPHWIEQLVDGGRIVVPMGGLWHQELVVVEKVGPGDIRQESICGCVFVPLIGEYGYKE